MERHNRCRREVLDSSSCTGNRLAVLFSCNGLFSFLIFAKKTLSMNAEVHMNLSQVRFCLLHYITNKLTMICGAAFISLYVLHGKATP